MLKQREAVNASRCFEWLRFNPPVIPSGFNNRFYQLDRVNFAEPLFVTTLCFDQPIQF